MASIATQSVPQLMAMQLPLMVPMDIQPRQPPSISTSNLNGHGQLIHKPARYEHLVKWKTQQQEEVESCKAHKTRTTDELHAQRTPPPSTSHTECSKTPSKPTTRCREQWAKQKERQTVSQTSSSTGATVQRKVRPTKHSGTQTKTAQDLVQPQQMLPAHHSDSHQSCQESHQRDNCHPQGRDHSRHQDNAT
uniref:Uncharacterized protein n=1 Tax=Romanomermis culicivorax TaxID=13658 RepID=A0A915IDM4_ROMCU